MRVVSLAGSHPAARSSCQSARGVDSAAAGCGGRPQRGDVGWVHAHSRGSGHHDATGQLQEAGVQLVGGFGG